MNITFIKFPEIENHYRKEYIDKFIQIFPDLSNCKFTIESKIDGSNLSIICKPNGEVRFASRNQLIGDTFNGLLRIKEKYENEIKILSNYACKEKKLCQFYGELFGKGIINRINYGNDQYLRLFALRINGEFQPPIVLYDLLKKLNLEDIKIPVLGEVSGVENALNWNEKYINLINPDSMDDEEGIVIKPLNKIYRLNNGDIFLIKKKNKAFAENVKRKSLKIKKDVPDYIVKIKESFQNYITESRCYSAFSKEGKVISDVSEIGHYLKIIQEDAKEDWKKDNPDIILPPNEEKIALNAGPKISKLLINMITK